MSVLIPVSIDANYDKDREKLRELNQHLKLFYNEDDGEVSFNFDIDKDDHYAIITVNIAELLEAVGSVMLRNEL